MGFSFIRKTASTGSSATGALVAAGSLQPALPTSNKVANTITISVTCEEEEEAK